MGLHPRGNFEGWQLAGSRQKWLEVHGDTHFTHFYSNYGETLQKRFFGHFLKGESTGWERQPPVSLNVRHPGETFALRAENEWPLARTQWTKYFLQPDGSRPGHRATRARDDVELRDDRRRPHLPYAAADRASRDHRPGGGEAVGVVADHRRRSFPGAAGVRSRRQGGGVRRLQRSARAGGAGLAARLPSQARSPAHAAVSALAQPRRGMAADAGRAGRARHRDLADLDRGAARLSHRAHRARQGL